MLSTRLRTDFTPFEPTVSFEGSSALESTVRSVLNNRHPWCITRSSTYACAFPQIFFPSIVLMPIVYMWIFFQSKFHTAMGINVYYFFASIYGWIRWNRYSSERSNLQSGAVSQNFFV